MADFAVNITFDWLSWHLAVQRSLDEESAQTVSEWVEADFGWWCLGHNFDVVATILTMADVSWNKGFHAGRAIASICENWESVQGLEDPGN